MKTRILLYAALLLLGCVSPADGQTNYRFEHLKSTESFTFETTQGHVRTLDTEWRPMTMQGGISFNSADYSRVSIYLPAYRQWVTFNIDTTVINLRQDSVYSKKYRTLYTPIYVTNPYTGARTMHMKLVLWYNYGERKPWGYELRADDGRETPHRLFSRHRL